MRYQAMIATALALPEGDASSRAAKWRQLVDLMVQLRDRLDEITRDDAMIAIERLRGDVSRDQRRRAAEALGGRGGALELFGQEEPGIAAPVLLSANLSEAIWLRTIPKLPRASRALLRNRRDLPAAVIRALESFGPSDLALPAARDEAAHDRTSGQIRDLVARIEAFKRTVPELAKAVPGAISEFRFETDAAGLIDWADIEAAPAIVGTTIGEPAQAGGVGVDGHAAGAVLRRAPFRNARLALPVGVLGGDWRISGMPLFDPNTGRFAGYRGTARRPRRDEMAQPTATIAGSAFSIDSMRALIHELRTPLNAILGFSSMIEEQVMGPVASAYRDRAAQIRAAGERLVALLDELDQASRLDLPVLGERTIDDLRGFVASELSLIASGEGRTSPLLVTGETGLAVPVDAEGSLARSLMRVLAALLARTEHDEPLEISVHSLGRMAEINVVRPQQLAGLNADVLLNTGPLADAPLEQGSVLGFGFAVRVLDGALRAKGGYLSIRSDSFVIALPREGVRDSNAQ